MKLTKILALILALVMMVSLVACGGQPSASDTPDAPDANAPQAAPEAGAEELYTLDILVDVAAPYVESSLDTVVGQKIAEDHGIAFNYVGYTGDMNEYQAMMLAGGTFNEIAYMRSTPMIKQYIEADALVNLDDYKDILPDFSIWNSLLLSLSQERHFSKNMLHIDDIL